MKREQNHKKKVLIIARDFLPYYPSLGGVIRVVKLALFLQENGYEVYVLCAKGIKISYFGYENMVSKLNVVYVDDKLQRYLNKMVVAGTNNKDSSPTKMQGLKKIINDFCIPDKGILFVNRYVKMASKLILEHSITSVIVSSPPHSTQIIGLKLKHKFGNKINLIVDYRDSWNTRGIFQKRFWLSKRLNLLQEKEVLRAADMLTYVSRPMLDKINSMIMDVSDKSLLVMNGFDLNMKKNDFRSISPNQELTIGYFGSISDNENSSVNPTSFFRALLKVNNCIKLVFYGPVELKREWQESLGDRLEINEPVSHTEAVELMRTMDLLLVVYSETIGGGEVITGKIFDYFLALRPVLVVGPKDLEAARLVKENHLGYCMDVMDNDQMESMIQDIFKDWQHGQLTSYSMEDVAQFSRQEQFAKLCKIL